MPSCFRNHKTFPLAHSQEERVQLLMQFYSTLFFPSLGEIGAFSACAFTLPTVPCVLPSSSQLQHLLEPQPQLCLSVLVTSVEARDGGMNETATVCALWEVTASQRRKARQQHAHHHDKGRQYREGRRAGNF